MIGNLHELFHKEPERNAEAVRASIRKKVAELISQFSTGELQNVVDAGRSLQTLKDVEAEIEEADLVRLDVLNDFLLEFAMEHPAKNHTH